MLIGIVGSMHMSIENNGSFEDMGHGAFPIEEVPKLSVLDIRLANAYRHALFLSFDACGGLFILINFLLFI